MLLASESATPFEGYFLIRLHANRAEAEHGCTHQQRDHTF
jgi:hypothetical protein